MDRRFERRLAYIGSSWQILSGLSTIIIYSVIIKKLGLNVTGTSQLSINAAQSVMDSIYSFSTTIGILFVGIGLVNLYLSKRLRNMEVEKKIPIWFIICGIVSCLIMDFLSCIVFIASGVMAMAKNKSINLMKSCAHQQK